MQQLLHDQEAERVGLGLLDLVRTQQPEDAQLLTGGDGRQAQHRHFLDLVVVDEQVIALLAHALGVLHPLGLIPLVFSDEDNLQFVNILPLVGSFEVNCILFGFLVVTPDNAEFLNTNHVLTKVDGLGRDALDAFVVGGEVHPVLRRTHFLLVIVKCSQWQFGLLALVCNAEVNSQVAELFCHTE